MDNKTIAELKESGDYDQIFNSYLRMVKKVCRVCNDASDDSIADGMLGLYKAIEGFNPELGVSKERVKQIVNKSLEHLRKWYSLNYFLE